jgi:hypothetical protein
MLPLLMSERVVSRFDESIVPLSAGFDCISSPIRIVYAAPSFAIHHRHELYPSDEIQI